MKNLLYHAVVMGDEYGRVAYEETTLGAVVSAIAFVVLLAVFLSLVVII